ncbi:MAG: lipoprotein [Pseudohongiellaceae bacterium]|jgi:lipid-binding SYLF domain-containing protein
MTASSIQNLIQNPRLQNRFVTLIFALLTVIASILLASTADAASAEEIDARIEEAMAEFYEESSAGRALAQRAAGMLVFPRVIKAGIGIGGEYGEGALLVNGGTEAYYSVASASVGFQLGVQRKAQVIMFMTEEALENFRTSDGWEAGVDGSVAVVEFGAAEEISTSNIQQPIVGFVFSNRGLMYNLTFEGSKISEINR